MTLGLTILLIGGALLYAGVTGRSVWALLRGDDSTMSTVVNGSLTRKGNNG